MYKHFKNRPPESFWLCALAPAQRGASAQAWDPCGEPCGSPAAARVAAQEQLTALAAHGAVRLVAVVVVHVEELEEAVLAAERDACKVRGWAQQPSPAGSSALGRSHTTGR